MIERIAISLSIKVQFIILGNIDQGASQFDGDNIEFFGIDRHALLPCFTGFIGAVRRCDVIFDIGAGDSFSDIYGKKRFIYQLVTKEHVLRSGVPLILSPQTIGPFKTKFTSVLSAMTMRRCKAVMARDHASYELGKQLGLRHNLHESIDVAFTLPFDLAKAYRKDKTERIGVNVSGLLFNQSTMMRKIFGLTLDYPELMITVIRHFVEDGCDVCLVGHVFSGKDTIEDDYTANLRIKGQCPRVVLAPIFKTPCEAKTYIANMDFFIGARMHACIAAFSAGVPVVPVGYTRKFRGLFSSLNYDPVVDCTAQTLEEAVRTVIEGYRVRDSLRRVIHDSKSIVKQRLVTYENIVRTQLDMLAR
jgi:colanic acid/amylovoran biosynthesis protein